MCSEKLLDSLKGDAVETSSREPAMNGAHFDGMSSASGSGSLAKSRLLRL